MQVLKSDLIFTKKSLHQIERDLSCRILWSVPEFNKRRWHDLHGHPSGLHGQLGFKFLGINSSSSSLWNFASSQFWVCILFLLNLQSHLLFNCNKPVFWMALYVFMIWKFHRNFTNWHYDCKDFILFFK